MKVSITVKIWFLSILIVTTSILIVYALFNSNKRLRNSEQWVTHTEQVLSESDEVLSLTKDIENASRGYVITCDTSNLTSIPAMQAAALVDIAALTLLTRDNPEQNTRVDSLGQYMKRQIAFSQLMISTRNTLGADAALAMISTHPDRQYTGRIHDIIGEIQQEEKILLTQRKQINSGSVNILQWFSWGLTVGVILFTILLLISLSNYWQKERHERTLEAVNDHLEQQVTARTAGMEKYRYFFYHTLDLACFVNKEGDFQEVNQNFSRVLGYSMEDLVGKKVFEFIHPDDIASTEKVLELLAQGEPAIHFINRYKTKEGMYKHLEWNATYNENTQMVHAIARNVSERIVAVRELAYQHKEKGKRASELCLANKELVYQNNEKEKRAAELLIANSELAYQNIEKGKRADELAVANEELIFQNNEKGKRAAELIIANEELAYQNMEKGKRADELAVANEELAYQNIEKGKRADELLIAYQELAYQNREKGKRAEELAIANEELVFQNDEKGKRAAELLITNDELKSARDSIHKLNEDLEQKVTNRTAELQSANKELESFSYSVSHDLRAPMIAITGFAQIINTEFAHGFDPELQELFGHIESSSVRMTAIIDDLLVLAKNDKDKLHMKEVDLNGLFTDVWADLLYSAPHHAIIEMEQMPSVHADASMLRQVVVNLLSNAIKYSSKKPRPVIEVGYETHDGRMIISVSDNGAGFDMKFYDRLFGAFQRLHGVSEFAGTGVGLTLVKRIIDRHGGEVWAEGQVDKGATFYFSLPIVTIGRKMSLAGIKSVAAG